MNGYLSLKLPPLPAAVIDLHFNNIKCISWCYLAWTISTVCYTLDGTEWWWTLIISLERNFAKLGKLLIKFRLCHTNTNIIPTDKKWERERLELSFLDAIASLDLVVSVSK